MFNSSCVEHIPYIFVIYWPWLKVFKIYVNKVNIYLLDTIAELRNCIFGNIVNIPIKIHSTDVRNMIKDGKVPYPWVTKETYNVIKEKSLYGIKSKE